MRKKKSLNWPSQSLVNKIAIALAILLCIYGMCTNYFLFVKHSEDVVYLKAIVVDKRYSRVSVRERWNLTIEYQYEANHYHRFLSCSKDDYSKISIGDSVEVKINKNKPNYPHHIHDGVIGYNKLF